MSVSKEVTGTNARKLNDQRIEVQVETEEEIQYLNLTPKAVNQLVVQLSAAIYTN
jgi:hypothetical protein